MASPPKQRLRSKPCGPRQAYKFRVNGNLIENDNGNHSIGAFALSYQGSGFEIRVGSDAIAYVFQGGGALVPFETDTGTATHPHLWRPTGPEGSVATQHGSPPLRNASERCRR